MNRRELNLLLYLETCAVDGSGKVDLMKVSVEEEAWIEKWKSKGLLDFERIKYNDCKVTRTKTLTHWVHLSDKAWKLVADERKKRAERLWEKRNFERTNENTNRRA